MSPFEIEIALKRMTDTFAAPRGIQANAEITEYRRALVAFTRSEVEIAFDWLKSNRTSRSWPTMKEIRDAVKATGGTGAKNEEEAKSYEELCAERDAEAHKLYEEMPNPQRDIARAEGFEPSYRQSAEQEIRQRLRNGGDVYRLPVLGEDPGNHFVPPGLFLYLRQQAACFLEAKKWRDTSGFKNPVARTVRKAIIG